MLGNIAISTDSGLKGGIFLSEIFKKVNVGAEKMVQSAKCKHEDLSSFASTHINSQIWVYAPVTPPLWK